MTPSPRPNYRKSEVTGLATRYVELLEKQGTHNDGALVVLCRLADLRAAVVHLSPKQREAILLTGILGWSNTATADALGISEAAVRQRFEHAVERLTEIMNQGGR